MGSAQSARRIQPGGGSGRAGGPADLSRPPFLPTPPPVLPPRPPLPLPLLLSGAGAGGGLRPVRGWAGGAGGGVGGGPPPGRRPAAAGRISTAAVRRDRLRDGWEGPAGKVARGAPSLLRPPAPPPPVGVAAAAAVAAAGPPPECYSPPAAALAESRGRGSQTRRRALPPPGAHPRGGPPRGGPPRGGAPASLVGGRAAPPTVRPLSHPLPAPPATGVRAGGGGADCPQCAPGGSRRRARGFGFSRATRASPEEGDGGASARGRRRCRLPTRPVLKHGPRSLTRARVGGSHESRRGAMKVKAGALAGRGGIPRPLQSAEGAPPARLARRAGEVEHERTC